MPPPPGRRYTARIILATVVAITCAAAAVVTGGIAHAELTRGPRQSELTAAAAVGLAQRWERVAAGTLFPETVSYSTDLLTQENATRIGIGPATRCSVAVDQTLTALAGRYGCRNAVRASYVDALGGTVYTVGVLAFATTHAASAFYSKMPASGFPATGLHPLALAGTSSALFGDAARQQANAQTTGPYVVLVVAGYSDGRAAAATGQRRSSAFMPAAKILAAVAAPLSTPESVNCEVTTEWSC